MGVGYGDFLATRGLTRKKVVGCGLLVVSEGQTTARAKAELVGERGRGLRRVGVRRGPSRWKDALRMTASTDNGKRKGGGCI